MRSKLCVLSAVLGIFAVSCVTQATDEEISSMCDNLVQLRGEVSNPSAETVISDIEVRFDKQTKQLEENRMREQKALNDELKAKLDAAEDDAEKEKLKAEYDTKLKEMSAKHEPAIAAMAAQKQDAVNAAKQQAEENRAVWNEAVNQCVTQAKKEGVSQKVARCRIHADTTDKYWNACR